MKNLDLHGRHSGTRFTSLYLGALLLGSAVLTSCGDGKVTQERQAPLVTTTTPKMHVFRDEVQAVGTARANEQVTLAANVTERIERLLFDDGMFVRSGQLLAVLSNSQERAALAGARASASEASLQLDRIKTLNDQGFATRTLLDQQRARLSQAQAEEAGIHAQIGDRLIRAPFSGYVSLRTISEGAVITSGTPLVTVSDISRIKLDFTVPETLLASLKPGLPIRAFASAYPDTPINGTISTIDPVIDPQSRAVMVRAILPNPDARIKPGMLLTVRIQTSQRTGFAVPESAVMSQGETRYVFTVNSEQKVERATVKLSLRDNGLIEVTGLPDDAQVISEGVVKVAEGRKVRISEMEGSDTAENTLNSAQPNSKPTKASP